MLNISKISKSFASRSILHEVTFSLKEGSLSALIGPSGGGKSVLLKIIGQIIRPSSGTIDFHGTDDFPVSLMFQEGALFDSMSVLDNVAFPLVQGTVPHTILPKAERKIVTDKCIEVLERVGLVKAIAKFPGQLSGGMRRRVSLARALVAKPKLLLLDDPTSGLDPVASSVIMELIADIHRQYQPTILIVSHDLRRLFPVVECTYALFSGRIIFSGTIDEIAKNGCSVLKRFVSARYDLEGRSCVDTHATK